MRTLFLFLAFPAVVWAIPPRFRPLPPNELYIELKSFRKGWFDVRQRLPIRLFTPDDSTFGFFHFEFESNTFAGTEFLSMVGETPIPGAWQFREPHLLFLPAAAGMKPIWIGTVGKKELSRGIYPIQINPEHFLYLGPSSSDAGKLAIKVYQVPKGERLPMDHLEKGPVTFKQVDGKWVPEELSLTVNGRYVFLSGNFTRVGGAFFFTTMGNTVQVGKVVSEEPLEVEFGPQVRVFGGFVRQTHGTYTQFLRTKQFIFDFPEFQAPTQASPDLTLLCTQILTR